MLWVLMTTFNRKDKTIACIESIKKAYSEDFIVVDADAALIGLESYVAFVTLRHR